MQIKVTTRHGQLSDEHQAIIRDKVSRLLHHFPRLMMIEAIVDVKDDEKIVELQVSAEHKHDFVARESAGEIQAALDQAIHKIERQLTKHKEKIQDHRRDQHVGEITRVERE